MEALSYSPSSPSSSSLSCLRNRASTEALMKPASAFPRRRRIGVLSAVASCDPENPKNHRNRTSSPSSSSSSSSSGGGASPTKSRERWETESFLHRCLEVDFPFDFSAPLGFSPSGSGDVLRVAYQGNSGSYSEEALYQAYPRSEAIPCREFNSAFKALENRAADIALVPVENSIDGSIHRNYDLLFRHRNQVRIVGELQWQVNHCLLSLPGARKENIRRIISHPQALAHCKKHIESLGLNHIRIESTVDPVMAAQLVAAENQIDTAAIASSRAAPIYGLNVMSEMMQDEPGNVTRFLKLARIPSPSSSPSSRSDGREKKQVNMKKVSIVVGLENGAAGLHKVLLAFARHGIEVSRLESRPWTTESGKYVQTSSASVFGCVFFIDIETSNGLQKALNTVKQLRDFAPLVTVLGSYPVHSSSVLW